MCGIAGFSLAAGGSFRADHLKSTLTALAHRGPDDAGVYEDTKHGIGLAHTRLAILDLSPLGHQPMVGDNGRLVIVFNGEIYNFRELRTELEDLGHKFLGNSDTEVLLHLYLDCRERCLDLSVALRKLNGIFSFALWDADRNALLLARDALGVKPFYYSTSEGSFSFSSEIKALQELIPSLGELDVCSIQRYLSFLWCPGTGTPVLNIHKLGPGEAMWVRNGKIIDTLTWYCLPAFRPRSNWVSEVEAVHRTAKLLRQAVFRQMVADVPVGAFLSGGLDSSSVVAFARDRNPDICCFTIECVGNSEEGIVYDLPYARQVSKHLGVNLEVVRIDADHMAQDLTTMIEKLEEPLADPAPLNVLYISRLARERGIKVLLSGAGGDDLFTGYRRHYALMLERYWTWLPRPIRAGLEHLSQRLDARTVLGRRLRKMFNGAALDNDARLINYFLWSKREDLQALYSPAFREALGEAMAQAPMEDFLSGLPSEIEPLERMLVLEQRFFLADHNLTYTDKMSMAVGMEVRVPFLDLDLVEFANRIPVHLKQRGCKGKWVFKKAMEPYLPHEVIWRPKSGFGAPLRRWMRFELRDFLRDVLSPTRLQSRGLFEPDAVQQLIDANDAGKIDASYTLLSLMCIELWCRHFMDSSSADRGALPKLEES